jgi:hypothetical protein
MNELDKIDRLDATLLKVHEVAERLARCAEAVANPTYSVVRRGFNGNELLEIVSVRMTAGQIIITVKGQEQPPQDPYSRNTITSETPPRGLIQR